MKPKDAIKLKKVLLFENYPLEDTLPEDGLYHHLLQPGEEHTMTNINKQWTEFGPRKVTD